MQKRNAEGLVTGQSEPVSLGDPRATIERLRMGADQIIYRLRMLSASVGPASQTSQFYTRSRSKTEKSIRGKILKYQRQFDSEGASSFSFRDITDYAGYRIVTLYDDELFESLRFIVNLVQAGMRIDQPIFQLGEIHAPQCFREASFISRTDSSDDIYQKLKDEFSSLLKAGSDPLHSDSLTRVIDKQVKLRTRDPSDKSLPYSSAHFLFFGLAYVDGIALYVPVEFQIRTVAEDFWSEINHKSLYKISDDYVWTLYYENEVTQATKLSHDLKDRLDAIPDLVKRFSVHTNSAERAISGIFSLSETESEAIHSSLITALFFFTGGFEFSSVVRNDSSIVFNDFMSNYGEFLKKLKKGGAKSVAISDIHRGIELLNDMIGKNGKYGDRLEVELTERPDNTLELFSQRDILLRVEVTRLQAIAMLKYGVFLRKDGGDYETDVGGAPVALSHDEERKAFNRVYIDLCSFIDNDRLKARPVCMIYYWKYIVASRISDSLARADIATAYEEMAMDGTVAEWSIYRVIVPRSLAESVFGEVKDLLSTFDPQEIATNTMLTLRSGIQEELGAALVYSLEAYTEHHLSLRRRGDLHLGFSPEEDIIDSFNVASIMWLYFDYFGLPLVVGRGDLSVQAENAALYFLDKVNDPEFSNIIKGAEIRDDALQIALHLQRDWEGVFGAGKGSS